MLRSPCLAVALVVSLSLQIACSSEDAGSSTADAAPPPSDAAGGEPDSSGVVPDAADGTEHFSFFVTSIATLRKQSGSQDGFGGNLGGLAGADAICQKAAADVGYGHKTWRAFLSAYNGGAPIHAIDRIGQGPWYDRNGRLIAQNLAGLVNVGISGRPQGDLQAVGEMCDEFGASLKAQGDTHDTLTASDKTGHFIGTSADASCKDWTDATLIPAAGLQIGHSWPRVAGGNAGQHWISDHFAGGCKPSVNIVPGASAPGTVGSGGGFGGFYCFALTP